MNKYSVIFLFLFLPFALLADGDYSIFKDAAALEIIREGGGYIYNMQHEKADSVIAVLSRSIPDHPVVSMMHALNIAWREMPITKESEYFKKHEFYIKKCLTQAEKMYKANPAGHDGIFFQIVSRGLLAEYYSNSGNFMKAVGEAKKIYGLIRKADKLKDENPEFLFSVGLYNYYREYYEENNPMMKPLLWFFRNGDKSLGLKQLEMATQQAMLSKVEAYIYLSYIYLRYEKIPNKSIRLLEEIVTELPQNSFIKAKLAECLIKKGEGDRASAYYEDLIESDDSYYKMSGYTLKGIHLMERTPQDTAIFETYFEKGVEESRLVPMSRGKQLRSLAHLNLGKIYLAKNNLDRARPLLQHTADFTDDSKIRKEAKRLLQSIE